MLQEIDEIEKKYELNLPNLEQRDIEYNINEMYEYINETKDALEQEVQKIKEAEQHIQKFQNALISVKNIESLDVPLDDLFACEYITIRFGRLPNDSVEKLSLIFKINHMFLKHLTLIKATRGVCILQPMNTNEKLTTFFLHSSLKESLFLISFMGLLKKQSLR